MYMKIYSNKDIETKEYMDMKIDLDMTWMWTWV
jgi:hypothetical protein